MLDSLPLRISVLVICVLWTVPTLGLFISSFRNPQLITQTGWWEALIHPFEQGWTLQNYQQVIGSNGMGEAFLNSLIVTIPATVIPITIAAFAAYAFAWIPFRGRGILFTIVVALLVVPLQMALIPILQLYSGLGLYGTTFVYDGWTIPWIGRLSFMLPLVCGVGVRPRLLASSRRLANCRQPKTSLTRIQAPFGPTARSLAS